MKVTYLIDNAVRELLINTYIGELLAAKGDQYKIDDYDFFYSENGYDFLSRTKYRTDITIYPSYNVKRTPEQLSRAINTGSMMVASHAEQIFNESLYGEKYNLRDIKSFNRHISGHLVWGEKFARSLQKYSNIPREKIYIVGNPKLDINKKKSGDIEPRDTGKRVLIVSDFSFGDLSDEDWKMFQKRYNSSYKTPLNRFFKEAREICIEWVSEMAKKYRGIEFLVRIHPGESKDAYKILKEDENVKIVGERDFIDDLLESEIVFSFTSTSIFEILSLQIPVFNLDLLPVPEERKLDYYELFEMIDKSAFDDILKQYQGGEKFDINDQRRSLMTKYMFDAFDDKSLLRTAIALTEICNLEQRRFNQKDKLVHYRNLFVSFLKDSIVKSGVFLKRKLKINNWVYSFAKRRRENEESLNVTATQDRIDFAKRQSKMLLKSVEVDQLMKANYRIVQREEGKYIYLDEN